MKKIGLTQRVQKLPNRNERRDCLDQAWALLLAENNMIAIPLPNHGEVEDLFSILSLDGIILTGGNDICHLPGSKDGAPERDRFERALLDYCIPKSIPILGVCRGMQYMADYHGANLAPIEDHVATLHELQIRKRGVMPLLPEEKVNSFHNFGLFEEVKGFDIIATTADGSVEAIAHQRGKQWGIMWHPERLPFHSFNSTLLRGFFYDDPS